MQASEMMMILNEILHRYGDGEVVVDTDTEFREILSIEPEGETRHLYFLNLGRHNEAFLTQ